MHPSPSPIRALLCRALTAGACLAALFPAWTGCDAVQPVDEERLVVEAFLNADQPPPPVMLRRTLPLAVPYPSDAAAIADAEVVLQLDGVPLRYEPVPEVPGRFEPLDLGSPIQPGTRYRLDVRWRTNAAFAEGTVPPPIRLDSVHLQIPNAPVQAALVDTLIVGLDSLVVDLQTRRGFIYPVEATLWWTVDPAAEQADSLYWVQMQLKPTPRFSSTVVDFFLLPEQVLQEHTLPVDLLGRRRWTGVYAVPVEAETDPVPPHRLRVSLLRSGQDYARFATSRDTPIRREPVFNVQGAIGIVAGISVDSLTVQVR